MKKNILMIIGLLVLIVIISLAYQSRYLVSKFYKDCNDLAIGMSQEEVSNRMSGHSLVEEGAGNFGWNRRMSFDKVFNFSTKNDNWQCNVMFKDNLVISIDQKFE